MPIPSFTILWRRYYFFPSYKQWKQSQIHPVKHGKRHTGVDGGYWIQQHSGSVPLHHVAPNALGSLSPNRDYSQRRKWFIKQNSEDMKISHFSDLASWIASWVAVVDGSVTVANTTARQKFHSKWPKCPVEREMTLSQMGKEKVLCLWLLMAKVLWISWNVPPTWVLMEFMNVLTILNFLIFWKNMLTSKTNNPIHFVFVSDLFLSEHKQNLSTHTDGNQFWFSLDLWRLLSEKSKKINQVHSLSSRIVITGNQIQKLIIAIHCYKHVLSGAYSLNKNALNTDPMQIPLRIQI